MARLFIPPAWFEGETIRIAGETLRHLRAVLRLGPGAEFTATDGAGGEFAARLERLGRDEARALILERRTPQRESPLVTVLAQAVPKGDRFAIALRQAVELGVTEIVPVVSRRTVAGGAPGSGDARAGRWQRILEAAVAQSGRTRLPVLHPPAGWEEVLERRAGAELGLLLWERAEDGLGKVLEGRAAPRSVLIAVGPEGGFSDDEAERAVRGGFVGARIGPRILRTESVGLAALAVLQHRWGDLG